MAKILIVEDSNDFRNVVKNLLKKKFTDVEIFEASSAELGLGQAVHENPDVILMDIHLPRMNGIDAAKMIREEGIKSKVIILTMFAKEDARKMCSDNSVDDLIGKNELYQKLIPTIQKYLKGAEK